MTIYKHARGPRSLANDRNSAPGRSASSWILSGVILGVLAVASSTAGAADSTAQRQEQRQYDIPAGALDGALKAFASQAGVTLSVDASLTERKPSPGLHGSYSIKEGFVALLAGSGLQVIEAGDLVYSVRAIPAGRDSAASNQAPGTQTLGRIRVEGQTAEPSTEGTGSYTSNAITIGKTAHSLRETPQSISVITRQRIEDQNLTTLNQALNQSTGTLSYGNPQDNRAYSRGFMIEQIQRDGVPTALGFSMASPDLAIYDRVEVLRGASGLFNGAGQPGGTVNLVRKRALADTQFHTLAAGGSWNHYRVEADLTGALSSSGDLRGRLVAVYEDEESFRDVMNSQTQIVYGRIEYDLSPDTLLSAGGTWEKREVVSDYNGTPRFANGADLHLPRSTFLGVPWANWEFDKPELFAEVEHRWNDSWKSKLAVTRVRDDSEDLRGNSVWGAIDPVTFEGAVVYPGGLIDRENRQDALDATLNGTFQLFARPQELVLGVNYLDSKGSILQATLSGDSAPVDVFNFDPYAYPKPQGAPQVLASTGIDARQSGYYAALRSSITDSLTLSAGARWSRYTTSTRSLLTGDVSSENEVDDELTPYGALIYDFAENLSFYASYAEIFQVQDSYDYRGRLLPPILGANYEAGIKGEWREGMLNASLAVFRIDQTNRAQTDPANLSPCPGSPTGTCSIAEGEVRSEGVELELVGRLLAGMELSAGYTYNTTEYLRDRTDAGLPSSNQGRPFSLPTPEHLFRLWATYRLPGTWDRLSIGTGVTAQSEQGDNAYGDPAVKQGGYALWNAQASYAVNDRWRATLNAENLLDKVYYQGISSYTGGFNHYGEPRNFMLSVRASF